MQNSSVLLRSAMTSFLQEEEKWVHTKHTMISSQYVYDIVTVSVVEDKEECYYQASNFKLVNLLQERKTLTL